MSDAADNAPENSGGSGSIRAVAAASFIGTTIEWYDFFLYGTAAALVFNKLFFPQVDPTTGVIASFATFAVGFASRPIGGLIFGHLGDRIGRKTMLILSILIMGIGTFIIGLLPTYDAIGLAAPILLVAMRILQGIGIGGEWGGAVLMAVEHAPKRRRGFFGSWPQMGVPAGLLLSTGIYQLIQTSTTDEAFLSWAWRIPFLLSALLVVVGVVIRLKIMESPAFLAIKETKTQAARPLVDVLKTHPRQILVGVGMRAAENVLFPVFTVFVLTYGTRIGITEGTLLTGVIISSAVGLVSIPAWAALSDRLGRRPVYLAGAAFSVLMAFPFFWLVSTRTTILIWLAILLGVNVGHNLMYGTQAAYFAELFRTRLRYSGVSIVYQITAVFAGGLAPLIATTLLAAGAGNPALVAAYVAAICLIAALATYLAPETYRADITYDPTPEHTPARQPQPGPVVES